MSLSKISTGTVVKNQFQYKLKANIGLFTSLVMLQMFALLLSLGGNGGGMSGGQGFEIRDTYYGTYNIIAFTALWGFVHAVIMSTKTDWEKSFSFVGNRFTHDLSNILFLFFASLIAGIFTILSAFALRVIIYYFFDLKLLAGDNFIITIEEVGSGVLTAVLLLFLLCSVGYLLGTITRLHRLLPVILPVVIIGVIFALVRAGSNLMLRMYIFYFEESNAFFFIIKTGVSALVLLGIAILISSRTEVRK